MSKVEDNTTQILENMETAGYTGTFTPEEADSLGAFQEDAISFEDAQEAVFDSRED